MSDPRQRAVVAVRRRLQRRASPRLHMLALVTATGAVGFGASFLLLHAGLTSMVVRYPLALAVGYAAFLGLVGLWLRRFRLARRGDGASDRRTDGGVVDGGAVDLDVVEVPFGDLLARPASEPAFAGFGEGGGFAGGGSADAWGDEVAPAATALRGVPATTTPAPVVPSPAAPAPSTGGGFDWDLDEDALWLVPVLLVVVAACGAALYLVYTAPVLFAELLVDAGLSAGLYGRLSRIERRGWLRTAIRATVLPAVTVAALLAFAGFALQSLAPEAASIGPAVARLRAPDSPIR